MIIFFDQQNKATAYCDDWENIYLFSGRPVAYVFRDMIYTFSGKHIGWFDNGWIRDMYGYCVLASNFSGGMVFNVPVTVVMPSFSSPKQSLPLKGIRELPRLRPLYTNVWIRYEALEFLLGYE